MKTGTGTTYEVRFKNHDEFSALYIYCFVLCKIRNSQLFGKKRTKLGKNWGTAVYTRTKLATFQDLIGNVLDLIGTF